jgi:cell division protein ZapA (FtsZ GTPase activity inhibitor)
VHVALENQRDHLLAFAGVLDDKLSALRTSAGPAMRRPYDALSITLMCGNSA